MGRTDDRVDPCYLLPWWHEFIGDPPPPGCYLLHRTPAIEQVLQQDGEIIFQTFMTPSAAEHLSEEVFDQLDDVVDKALHTARVWPQKDWLHYWWLPGADDGELEYLTEQVIPRQAKKEGLDANSCPALVWLLTLLADNGAPDSVRLYLDAYLFPEVATLAVEEAWKRALITENLRRELKSGIGRLSKPRESNDWVRDHWWTGGG